MKGHFWTVAPTLVGLVRTPAVAAGQHIVALAEDAMFGTVEVTGVLNDVGSETLVVLLHGLGGNADSIYVRDACNHVMDAGFSCLRMSMRGADGSGEDIYHAGLTADLRAMLSTVELRAFTRILIVGYSLGGHLTLKAASEGLDARVAAIAAVSAPIDLSPGATSSTSRVAFSTASTFCRSCAPCTSAQATAGGIRRPLHACEKHESYASSTRSWSSHALVSKTLRTTTKPRASTRAERDHDPCAVRGKPD
ncbi:MAG: alpha/beta fold hydrolase [bacterium]